jgi:hypothetical protein
MKKSNKSVNLQVEAKILKGLNYLRNNFSETEALPWDNNVFHSECQTTRTFSTILVKLGVIKHPKKGIILLTDKFNSITPREIHLEMRKYATESVKRNNKLKEKLKAKELAKIQAQMQFENKQKLTGTKNNSGYKAVIDQEELRKQHLFGTDNLKDAFYPKQTDMYFPPIANKFEKPTVEEALSILKQAMKAELRETLRKEIIQELINKNI